MRILHPLFDNNRRWSEKMHQSDPDFFRQLVNQQNPKYLWIGCSDSRVPANEIVGLPPGELFVHRNIANLVIHTDMNCLSVLQYAVDVLGIEHVIVCGHYGCGGVKAALEGRAHGLVDNWLRHVRDIYQKHRAVLEAEGSDGACLRRLCELNVMEQVINVGSTTIVQDAWSRGQALAVHGWIYDLKDGLLKGLDVCVASGGELAALQGRDMTCAS